MTYKQIDSLTLDGVKEIEVTVSDFDQTVALLAAAGLRQGSFQESKRETWQLNDVEIVLDEWPWLKPYIEIEGPSEQKVRDVAVQLDLDWSDALFGDVMVAYRAEYHHLTERDTVGNLAEVRFSDPLPGLLQLKG
jgi:adenylate cyclase class 2